MAEQKPVATATDAALERLVAQWRERALTRSSEREISTLERCANDLEAALREQSAAPSWSIPIQELIDAGIQRGIGEHDMAQCRFCGNMGHNEVLNHIYGIRHAEKCVWLAAKLAVAAVRGERT